MHRDNIQVVFYFSIIRSLFLLLSLLGGGMGAILCGKPIKFVECQNATGQSYCLVHVAFGIAHLQVSHQGMYSYSPCLLE